MKPEGAKYRKKSYLRSKLRIHVVLSCMALVAVLVLYMGVGQGENGIVLTRSVLIAISVIETINIVQLVKYLFNYRRDLDRVISYLNISPGSDIESGSINGQINSDSLIDALLYVRQKEDASILLKKQAELNALQSQINPHFLYNTLETIRGQAICCGATDIVKTSKALADIFRYNISKHGVMITLKEELDNIDAYMMIQCIRFNNKFQLVKEIDEDTLDIRIPKLLIQPVVENALIHGLETKRDPGHITICSFRTEESLTVTIRDDGIGIDVERLKKLNGELMHSSLQQNANIGLVNINTRIQLIYGKKYGISIMSAKNIGTTVTLTLGIIM